MGMILPAIPTALSDREARFLSDLTRDKIVVEFGALLGFSTVVMAQGAVEVTSVDRHEGYTTPTLNQFISNLERYKVRDKVRIVLADALDRAYLADTAEIAFVDLTGAFKLTRDLLKKLQCPFVMVHDMNRAHCDVERAIKAAGWTPVSQCDTLVLCVRS